MILSAGCGIMVQKAREVLPYPKKNGPASGSAGSRRSPAQALHIGISICCILGLLAEQPDSFFFDFSICKRLIRSINFRSYTGMICTAICNSNGIIASIHILIQPIDGFGVEIFGTIGRNKSSPFGAVITGIQIIQAGIAVVVIATVANGVAYSDGSCVMNNRTVAPGIVSIFCNLYPACVVNGGHITLQVAPEVICVACAALRVNHTNNAAFVI